MYEHSDQVKITELSPANIEQPYESGYVFTRLGKGVMQQVKSVRVRLENFELSSENRRVLNKNAGLNLSHETLPLKGYTWTIARLGKDFYDKKFGPDIMSANKIKEMFCEPGKSNMNSAFAYSVSEKIAGYCLLYETKKIVHYAYPFYDLKINQPNLGMAMMIRAVLWAQEQSKEYIYLGSDSKYKHQFKGLEVFNPETKTWN